MSNIAGKAYAINVVSPTRWKGLVNRVIFRAVQTRLLASRLDGLLTLSLIHYARWVMVRPKDFPILSDDQPKEDIKLTYEFFYSNFNGSWDQYIDSFSMSIPAGLDLFWITNINYPKSVPIERFHKYINTNQIATEHYYNAYPLATSNDIKSAERVRSALSGLGSLAPSASDEAFAAAFTLALADLQHDLSQMEPSPIVSLANQAAQERRRVETMSGATGRHAVIDARPAESTTGVQS